MSPACNFQLMQATRAGLIACQTDWSPAAGPPTKRHQQFLSRAPPVQTPSVPGESQNSPVPQDDSHLKHCVMLPPALPDPTLSLSTVARRAWRPAKYVDSIRERTPLLWKKSSSQTSKAQTAAARRSNYVAQILWFFHSSKNCTPAVTNTHLSALCYWHSLPGLPLVALFCLSFNTLSLTHISILHENGGVGRGGGLSPVKYKGQW